MLHCPYCHGYEVRDTALAVLGGDNRPFSLHQAALVRQWSDDVVFFPHRIEITPTERDRLTAFGVHVLDGEVDSVVSDRGTVRGIALRSGQVIPRDVVFVGPRFLPRDTPLTDLGCVRDENGWISVDPTGRTAVAGVWAAGNVVDSPAQLIHASAAGARAAIAVNHHLLEHDIRNALVGT